MLAGMEMMSCPNLAVPAEVMQHIVNVESGHNPYAIGVVGGQLVRQPQNLDEAIATVQMLESKGYNYSLGLAQVNRNNLGKYGIDSYEKAFDRCTNLAVGARILADCYVSAQDWGKAFSCYYSGNYVTGFRDGYVQKVFDSIDRTTRSTTMVQTAPIQLANNQSAATRATTTTNSTRYSVPVATSDAAYRVAIRSSLLDTAVNALVAPAVASAADVPMPAQPQQQPATTQAGIPQTTQALQAMMQGAQAQRVATAQPPAPAQAGVPQTSAALQAMMRGAQAPAQQPGAALPPQAQVQAATVSPEAAMLQTIAQQDAEEQAAAAANATGVFTPQVRGPNDPAGGAVAAQQANGANAATNVDQANLRQGNSDGAFVF
jgi:type IV secretion system protein VirB1